MGVDLKDISIVPQGNEHLLIIEEAIKSDSLNVKLNALLRKELKGVVNVTKAIEDTYTYIIFSSIVIFILFLFYVITNILRKRFPVIFFNFNTFQDKKLLKVRKEREIILISIIIGFIINLISGVIISITF